MGGPARPAGGAHRDRRGRGLGLRPEQRPDQPGRRLPLGRCQGDGGIGRRDGATGGVHHHRGSQPARAAALAAAARPGPRGREPDHAGRGHRLVRGVLLPDGAGAERVGLLGAADGNGLPAVHRHDAGGVGGGRVADCPDRATAAARDRSRLLRRRPVLAVAGGRARHLRGRAARPDPGDRGRARAAVRPADAGQPGPGAGGGHRGRLRPAQHRPTGRRRHRPSGARHGGVDGRGQQHPCPFGDLSARAGGRLRPRVPGRGRRLGAAAADRPRHDPRPAGRPGRRPVTHSRPARGG